MGKKFGLSSNHLDANVHKTEKFLKEIAHIGFDFYELEVTNYSLMANHRWINKRKNDFVKMLNGTPLNYSLHMPLVIDLGDPNYRHERDFFKSFIEFGQEAGINDFVLHPSRCKNFGANELEIKHLLDIAPLFKNTGITVHLENLLNQKNHNGYSYNVSLQDNIKLLETLNNDCFGYCFDFGHGYITTNFREENFVDEVHSIAPKITHMHVHDNFGKIPEIGKNLNKHESTMMGFGDLHMPPTWGDIPYEKLKGTLKEFNGKITIELFKDYLTDLDDILATTKELFN